MSYCGSNIGMETSAHTWSMVSTITLCFTSTHTSVRCRLKSFTSCVFLVDSLPRFVMKMYWGQGCSAARNLGVLTGLLYYCIFRLEAANNAHNVRVDTTLGKDNDQQSLSEMPVWYRRVNKSLMMSEDTNNPVYKLMTGSLQLALTC